MGKKAPSRERRNRWTKAVKSFVQRRLDREVNYTGWPFNFYISVAIIKICFDSICHRLVIVFLIKKSSQTRKMSIPSINNHKIRRVGLFVFCFHGTLCEYVYIAQTYQFCVEISIYHLLTTVISFVTIKINVLYYFYVKFYFKTK